MHVNHVCWIKCHAFMSVLPIQGYLCSVCDSKCGDITSQRTELQLLAVTVQPQLCFLFIFYISKSHLLCSYYIMLYPQSRISVMLCLTELTLFLPLSAIDTHASVSIWYLQTNVSASDFASVWINEASAHEKLWTHSQREAAVPLPHISRFPSF